MTESLCDSESQKSCAAVNYAECRNLQLMYHRVVLLKYIKTTVSWIGLLGLKFHS